jgi:bifunctional non-homologous end joining protein LigD
MMLTRLREPFNHPEWVYEIKFDGFRALAYLNGDCKLVSRTGHIYKRFTDLSDSIADALRGNTAVLDGEIVCLDAEGKSQFYSLMFRRGPARFYAFDILELNGRDFRSLPLLKRKQHLKRLIPAHSLSLLYVDHVEGKGEELFELACREDLEGIVAKWKFGRYTNNLPSSWIKIKNPTYTQIVGREELFERKEAHGTNGSSKRVRERAAAVAG